MAAWEAFVYAHAAVFRHLERELLEETDLPPTWYDVLVNLAAAPERHLRMSDLADQVLLSRSGLTRLVDRMAADGLVTREPCATDARVTYAVLTDAGHAALKAAAPTHLRGIQEHFARHLSARELEVIRDALERVRAAATRTDQTGDRQAS